MTDGPLGFNDLTRVLDMRPGASGLYEVDDGRVQARYDIGTTTIYVGTAALGAAASAASWTIRKITLSGGNPTQSQWTALRTAVWNNRATETYT